MERIGVLFVCLGNICRSPLAEGAFRHLARERGLEDRFLIDSAGTSSWHVGEPADLRGREAAKARGIDISAKVARKLGVQDFYDFQYILAMDRGNLRHLEDMDPGAGTRLGLLLGYSSAGISEVPDPYYGGVRDFEKVLDLVSEGAEGLLMAIERDHFS